MHILYALVRVDYIDNIDVPEQISVGFQCGGLNGLLSVYQTADAFPSALYRPAFYRQQRAFTVSILSYSTANNVTYQNNPIRKKYN